MCHHCTAHRVMDIAYLSGCLSAFSASTPVVGHQEEHLACRKLSDEVMAWLSLWNKMQMICVWSSWCHCHPTISCFIKIQICLTFLVPASTGCRGKEVMKWVSVCELVLVCAFDLLMCDEFCPVMYNYSIPTLTLRASCTVPCPTLTWSYQMLQLVSFCCDDFNGYDRSSSFRRLFSFHLLSSVLFQLYPELTVTLLRG